MRNLRQIDIGALAAEGFTLIELIVVVALISVMFLFVAPKIMGRIIPSDTNKVVRWIVNRAQLLKNEALTQKKRYTMHIETDLDIIWVSSEDMDEEAQMAARESGYEAGENADIVDVEFPGWEQDNAGKAKINFYPGGYCDKAAIHLENDTLDVTTILLEPFLPNIKLFDERVGFDG